MTKLLSYDQPETPRANWFLHHEQRAKRIKVHHSIHELIPHGFRFGITEVAIVITLTEVAVVLAILIGIIWR